MQNFGQVKVDTRVFWDLNPCGSSETWEHARETRYRFTDPYLEPYLTGPFFKGKSVLEIGCGQGLDASQIVQHCSSYVGLDLSSTSLHLAQREVYVRRPDDRSVTFLNGDAEHLCFSNDSFDIVYSIGVLHHTPGFKVALNEIYRVLRPGGTLVLMLYRAFTPLWTVLRIVRGVLKTPRIGPYIQRRMLGSLRRKSKVSESYTGTALLELVGCPLINTYTLYELRRHFRGYFRIVHSECHRVGLEQIIRVIPPWCRAWWPQNTLEKLEKQLGRWFGFYLFIIAEKNPQS